MITFFQTFFFVLARNKFEIDVFWNLYFYVLCDNVNHNYCFVGPINDCV